MMYHVASISKAGPRLVNEDAVGDWELAPDRIVAVVADGLGGMGGGSRASQLAIQLFHDGMATDQMSVVCMVELAKRIHETIRQVQTSEPELRNMATTLTGISIQESQLLGVHCGDTRAAVARGDGIRRLTNDHTEGARFYRVGKLTKQEFFEYPRKNILDSALGVHNEPQIDNFSFSLQVGDRIFLTSDGLHQKVLLREIREISTHHIDPKRFLDEVNSVVERRKPVDNYSIIAIFCV